MFVEMMIPVALLGLGMVALWVWMIVDCVQNEPSDGNTKVVWILVIVLAGWIGALIYYFYRRPRRRRELEGGATGMET